MPERGQRVFVTRAVPAAVRLKLERLFDTSVHDSPWPLERAEVLGRCRSAAGLVTMLTDTVDDELLDAAGPELRVVANYAVGHDNVDLEAASRRGVLVSTTPGVLTEATAELTLALMLCLLRRVGEGERLLRRREPWVWAPTFMLGRGLAGRTLGCVGFGRIGRAVARLAGAFGTRVVYTNRSGPADAPFPWLPLERLLTEADVVSLHCPLTPETHHLVDEAALRLMRPDAVLVNTARGPLVDEAALASALRTRRLAGAALDVFEHEPEVEEALLALENVILAPHLGSATDAAREAMGMVCVDALQAVLAERRAPPTALNPEVIESGKGLRAAGRYRAGNGDDRDE